MNDKLNAKLIPILNSLAVDCAFGAISREDLPVLVESALAQIKEEVVRLWPNRLNKGMVLRPDIVHWLINEAGTKGHSINHPDAEVWEIDPEWFIWKDDPEATKPFEPTNIIRIVPDPNPNDAKGDTTT